MYKAKLYEFALLTDGLIRDHIILWCCKLTDQSKAMATNRPDFAKNSASLLELLETQISKWTTLMSSERPEYI